MLAEANPQKEEVENKGPEVRTGEWQRTQGSKGETRKDGLAVSGSAAIVTGEVETKLSPAEIRVL